MASKPIDSDKEIPHVGHSVGTWHRGRISFCIPKHPLPSKLSFDSFSNLLASTSLLDRQNPLVEFCTLSGTLVYKPGYECGYYTGLLLFCRLLRRRRFYLFPWALGTVGRSIQKLLGFLLPSVPYVMMSELGRWRTSGGSTAGSWHLMMIRGLGGQ